MVYNDQVSPKLILIRFYRDAFKVLLNPKVFYESMPEQKDQQALIVFVTISSLLYSLAATLFTRDQQLIFLVMFFFNGLLMPILLAAILYLVLHLLQTGIGYGLALAITGYANAALFFAWIPAMAPFAELFRYYLIGVGIAKVAGLSGWKAFFVLLGMGALLLMMFYFLQMVIAH
ncbi:MAG: YIP1 family protein [Desulfobacterales bacterium]